ncbi:MAG: hypothetical protein ABJX32_10615 [Tateyamaria sp.]|uniref:hypothetical protein n=1 Tax=Tateyamaria sp. TaxID=1929288 RepID=UPI00329FDE5F
MTERSRLVASRDRLEAQAELSRRTTQRQTELRNRGFASDQAVGNVALALTAIEAQMAEVDAAITQVEVQLSQTELTAPFDGTIGARHVDPGAIVSVGAPSWISGRRQHHCSGLALIPNLPAGWLIIRRK